MGQAIITRRGGSSPQKKQAYVHSQNADIGVGTSMTVSLPSCDDGDLMLAYFMCRNAHSLPPGWTLAFEEGGLSGAGYTQYIGVAYKIKTSSDAASFTITQGASARIGAQIFSIKNAGEPYRVLAYTSPPLSEVGAYYVLPDTDTIDLVLWGLHSTAPTTFGNAEYVTTSPIMPTGHYLGNIKTSGAEIGDDSKNRLITICDALGNSVAKKMYRPNGSPISVIQLVAVGIPYSA